MHRRLYVCLAAVMVVMSLAAQVEAERRGPPTALTIGRLEPPAGAPGSEVTIRGAGFGTNRRAVRVTLAGRAVAVRSVEAGVIRFTVPPGARTGPVEVRVRGRRATSPAPFQVVVPVRVVSFSPATGGPGAEVTITGEGFAVPHGGNTVTLTGVPCQVLRGSGTSLVVRIPARVRSGVFEVEAGAGRRGSASRAFTVTGGTPPPPSTTGSGRPVIDRFAPPAGPVGTVVRIFGRNFSGRDEVWFSGRRLPVIERLPTRLTVEIPAGARTGRFSIRGRFTVESRQRFDVRAVVRAPTIASFTPAEGPPGTIVTIVGTNFGARSYQNRVVLGGRPCVVRSSSPTRLQIEVPAGASSTPFAVTVTGSGEAVSSGTFRVFAALSIASISPANGAEGTRVTIRGTGFAPSTRENRVTINGRPARVVSAGEGEIVIEVPRGATSGPVEVTSRGVRRRARDPFTVTNPPSVSRFAPRSGAPGTEVTLYGNNFGDTTHGLHVRIGGRECRLLSVGPTQIRVSVPAESSTGPFEVSVVGQGAARSRDSFTVFTPLAITRFTPARGPVGTQVTIRGTGFSPTTRSNRVFVGGRPARVLAAGDTELRIEIPRRVQGGPIRVQVRGRGTTETREEFTVIAAPIVASFSPSSGPPGTDVTLSGDHFGSTMGQVRVTLGGAECRLTSVGPTRIALQVPARASSGRFQVSVRGQGSGEATRDFEVVAPLTVGGFSPSGGGPGTEVTVTGSGFSARTRDNEVFLGRTAVQVVSARTDELRVRIPEGASTGRFRVRTSGRGEALSRTSFRVQIALSVDRVEPNTGQPGTEVRLHGRGLANRGLRVLLGGRPVRHTGVSDTELRVTIPTGARSGPFVIRVPRMGEARSRGDFTVTQPPVVASMSPVSGPVGTVVTIQGRGFSPNIGNNRVTLGGTQLRIEAVSPTQMRVRILAGVSSGRIRVEVRGRGYADTPMPYRLTGPSRPAPTPPPPTAGTTPPPPTGAPLPAIRLQGFSPRAGPPGTMVQLLGDGWGSRPQDLRVWIGRIQARVVRLDARMLTIQVPASATTGPLRVTRAGPGGGSTVVTPTSFTVQR